MFIKSSGKVELPFHLFIALSLKANKYPGTFPKPVKFPCPEYGSISMYPLPDVQLIAPAVGIDE